MKPITTQYLAGIKEAYETMRRILKNGGYPPEMRDFWKNKTPAN